MNVTTKKLIGTIATLLWIAFYAVFIAMPIGIRVLPDAHWTVELLYYALAGTIWIIPVGLALPWMYRQPVRK